MEDTRTRLEAERSSLQNQLREQERQNLQTTQQLQALQEDLGRAQNASSTLQSEDKERQARLSSEIEERERAQQELHQLKKQVSTDLDNSRRISLAPPGAKCFHSKFRTHLFITFFQIVELDSSLDVARQEMLRLRTRSDEEENRWRHREQELLVRLEDSRGRERKLEDQKHNLEVCLADATQQIQELKARLGGTEGRLKALDQQLQQVEAQKREVEQKLSSVGSTLRRIAGIQLDGSVSLPFKLMSPSRRWSPARYVFLF